MKKPTLLLLAACLSFLVYSQECIVEMETLKGSYTGDCKKGKASGKGKAIGYDTYEGDFKSGLPDGQGTYTWKDGNVYTGRYSKGMKEGKGMMKFKSENKQDSVVEGYWKKDIYIGRYERPYIVHSKTGSVRDVDIEYIKDNINKVKILVTNTTGGARTISGGEMPRMTVNNIAILNGNYERVAYLETHLKASETSLIEVDYPFRAKLSIGREEIEIELLEKGSYIINISINL